ncbi:hypothetical protein FHT44_000348 [Mycolicibacterium sp. BK634]|uniref:hypothetical protein n=1 Tax=Mycolicibacterium sp. BK634 TaxID=2587099 RepID=UPI0016138E1A|nr:hypothetical protein [Mycolicibacterium sp. BK634]MBB3747887.1 hypothetical protein [Mycolicibacterium sp. BK634]
MTATVYPHTRLASALLAAGVVAASPPLVQVAERPAPVVSFAAVQPVSVVTDVLQNLGDAVSGVTWVLGSPIYGLLSLPFNAVYALTTAVKDPALIPSVLSYLTQIYLNPDSASGGLAYGVKTGLSEIAATLPNPLGTWTTGTLNTLSGLVDSLFTAFPDPTPGGDVFEDLAFVKAPGRALWAVRQALVAPVEALADVITWLCYLPATLEATLESAIRDPAEIPGLFSNVVRSVLDLNAGVLGWVLEDLVRPFRYLPVPIGDDPANVYYGMASQFFSAQADNMEKLLDALLPVPVTPTPFKKAAAPKGVDKKAAADAVSTTGARRADTGVSARGRTTVKDARKAPSTSVKSSDTKAGSHRVTRRSGAG